MIRYLVLITSLLSSYIGISQSVIQRTNGTNTVNDPRFMSGKNFFTPRYADTTAANLDKGIDSCGALIYTYDINNCWIRMCSPKRWDRIGEVATASNGITKASGNFKWGGTLIEPTTITANGANNFTITGNPQSSGAVVNIIRSAGAGINSNALKVDGSGSPSGGSAIFAIGNSSSGALGAGTTGAFGTGASIGVSGFVDANGAIALQGVANAIDVGERIYPLSLKSIGGTIPGNIVLPSIYIERQSASAVGAGMGSGIEWAFQSYSNSGGTPTGLHTTAQMDVVGTNLFGSSTDYKYDFKAMGDSVMNTLLTLHGDGNIVLPRYNSTNYDIADPTGYKSLMIDNSGNVRKGTFTPGINLATGALTANGDYTHNWSDNNLTIDSIKILTLIARTLHSGLHKRASIFSDGGGAFPFSISHIIRNTSNTIDSVFNGMSLSGEQVKLNSTQVTGSGTKEASIGVQQLSNVSHVTLLADSVRIKSIPQSTADSILAIGPFNPNTGTNSIIKVSVADIAGSGLTIAEVRDEISDSLNVKDTITVGPAMEIYHVTPTKDSIALKIGSATITPSLYFGTDEDGIFGLQDVPVRSVAGKTGEVTIDGADIISGIIPDERSPEISGVEGTYTNLNATINKYGKIIAASNGTVGGGGGGSQNLDSATTSIMQATDSIYILAGSTSYTRVSDTITIPANYFRRGDRARFLIYPTFIVATNADTTNSDLDTLFMNLNGVRFPLYAKPDNRRVNALKIDVDLFRQGATGSTNDLLRYVDGKAKHWSTGELATLGFEQALTQTVVSGWTYGDPLYAYIEYKQTNLDADRSCRIQFFSLERDRADQYYVSSVIPPPPSPELSVSPSSLSGFTTTEGIESSSQSFSVSGDNLTANVTITAPTDYEVSLDDVSFAGTQNLTQSGGNIVSEPVTIYTRIKNTALEGSPSGNVTAASTGATTKNVAVSGTVGPTPSATVVAQFNFSLTANSGASGSVADWVDCLGLPGGVASGHTAAVRSASDSRSGSAIGVNTISTSNWAAITQASNTCASDVWGPTSCNVSCFFTAIALTRGGYGVEGTTSHSAGNEHFEFTGLNPAKHYKFEIIGSRTTGVASRRVLYTLVYDPAGATTATATLDVKDNTANVATFTGKLPKSDGTIRLHMRRDPTDSNNTFAAYVSAIRVTQED